MNFRPTLLPTLVTVPMLVVLIGLGTWQVHRLQWKQDLIERLQQRTAAEAVPLPAGPLSREEMEFRRVRVTGAFDHAHEFYLWNRLRNGRPGLNVLTPLVVAEGQGTILVNRGWIPVELQDPGTRTAGQVQGQVTLEGVLRFADRRSSLAKQNNSEKNIWFSVDPTAMAAVARLEAMPDHYIEMTDRDVPDGWPIGQEMRVNLTNNHLQYAVTWYSLAVALAVIYVVYHRRRREP